MSRRAEAIVYAAIGTFAAIIGIYIAVTGGQYALLGSGLIIAGSWIAGTAVGEMFR